MFNLINKNNRYKKIVFALLIGAIIFAISQNSNASFKEDYPRYRLKAGTNNIANMLSSWTKAVTSYESSKYDAANNKFSTDLFWDNASKYRARDQIKTLYWVESVKWVLEALYDNCKLEDKEIIWILYYSNWTGIYLKEEIDSVLPKEQLPTNKDKESWCFKLSKCIQKKNVQVMNEQCDKIVRDAYFDWVNLKERLSVLEESNLGNEKYYNWTLDDSTYDIFYDMWEISKIMYEDALGVTESSVIFYKMPQFGNGWGSDFWAATPNWGSSKWGSSNGWSKNSWTTTSVWGKNWVNNNWWNNNWWNLNGGIQNWSIQNGGNNNGWSKNWWGNSVPSITDDDEINDFLNYELQENRTVTAMGNTAYITKCVVSWSPKLEEAYLEAEEEAEENGGLVPSAFDMTDEEIQELVDDILANSEKINQVTSNPLPKENQKATDDVPWAMWASDDPAVIADLRTQLDSCVSKCDWLRFDEKAICKAKCLCSEYSSKALKEWAQYEFLKEWALRIRICNIPSKPVTVSTSTKTVLSIETILAEIYNTVKALFDSWELTPKMKKQEMLDSSLNNIKFSDVVSFNIWMQFKKPEPKRPVKKEELAELRSNLKNDVLAIDENTFNIAKEEGSSDSSMQDKKPPEQEPSSETTEALIDESRYASLNKTVKDFLENHRLLLVEVITVLTEIDNTLKWKL